MGWIVVDFEEDSVDTCRDSRSCKHRDELGLTAGDSVGCGRGLDGVGAVEDDGGEFAHDGQGAHIDDEVVVAEAGTALAKADAFVAGVANLGDGVLHVGRRDELALLDVDGAAAFGGGDEEIGLAAEEGWNLHDEFGVADGIREAGAVFRGVDVGEDWQASIFGDGAEDACAFDQAGAAEAADAGAVGFVVAGFEDVGDVEVRGDALDCLGEGAGVAFAFEDAGSADEEDLAVADFDGGNVKGVFRRRHLVIESQPGGAARCTKVGGAMRGATRVDCAMYHREQSHLASGV